MIYCFDIDGTLCRKTPDANYADAEPIQLMIDAVNRLYDEGHTIKLFTARGSTTGIDWRSVTEEQARTWGLRYHELILGKPEADLFIDDKAIEAARWCLEHTGQVLDADSGPVSRERRSNILEDEQYLHTTYSTTKVPPGSYPHLLAKYLQEKYFRDAKSVVDMGCGRGEFLRAFHELGLQVTGLDISTAAQKFVPDLTVHTVNLETHTPPLADGSVDAVFSKSVIEHMQQPMGLIQAAHDVLKPGGVAVLMAPSWQHTAWGPFYIDHTHVTPFTRPSLEEAMGMAGFKRVEVLHFRQLPILWSNPWLLPALMPLAWLPLSYRPYHKHAPWPNGANKLIRFMKEVMLLGVGYKD